MPKIAYVTRKFSAESEAVITSANKIIAEYQAMGFKLTLRQLYYQFVSRDLLPNKQAEYKRLGSIINDGRLAGLIDWEAIEDRGRNLVRSPSWESPDQIIASCAEQFRLDPWEKQRNYLECWVEKEALLGVVGVACEKWRVPYFACKGYTSQSEMWDAGRNRLGRRGSEGKYLSILHLGDHDPSGIDMTRDIQDRLRLFTRGMVVVRRLALNMEQVERWQPPPNPAKITDSRFAGYAAMHGNESWELDALGPQTIAELIEAEIGDYIDPAQWKLDMERERVARESLALISEQFEEVSRFAARPQEG